MRPVAGQLDLLDWRPPQPVARFDERAVRAHGVAAGMSRAIAASLRECEAPREVVARRMSEFLGQPVSRHMLDAYASQAREEHVISLTRFVALLHATGDRRLLQAVADLLGWAVIETRYLPLIELAAVQQQRQALAKQARVLSLAAARGKTRA